MQYTLINADTNVKLVVKTLKGFTVETKYVADGTKLDAFVYLRAESGDRYFLDCKNASSGFLVRKNESYVVYCESLTTICSGRQFAVEMLKAYADLYADSVKKLIALDVDDEKFFKAEADSLNQCEKFNNVMKETAKRSHKKGGK